MPPLIHLELPAIPAIPNISPPLTLKFISSTLQKIGFVQDGIGY